MEKLNSILKDAISEDKFIYGVLSNIRKKGEKTYNKVSIKPVLIKKEFYLQFTYYFDKKVTHKNLLVEEAIVEIKNLLGDYFKQGNLYSMEADYQILISKGGKIKVLTKAPSKAEIDLSHDRRKNYIIPENQKCPFLIRLGVMNENGKVYGKKYDKFKQINRFLEMVRDCLPYLDKNRTIRIIDFGCGKSYLTFALYYYLVEILGLSVEIVGLDLKKDVIEFCNKVATDLNYKGLSFKYGDIKEYEEKGKVDMVVSLHACDVATDAALAKSIRWDAKVILAVPCCQHELLDKIHNPIMLPMEKHGIIKEKLSSLITDSLRGMVLEIMGYSVQMLEFIDMEHTPKNILIRGFKSENKNSNALIEYKKFKEFWHIKEFYLEKELGIENFN